MCSSAWWLPQLPSVWSAARPIDASLIKADVDQRKRMPGEEAVNWPKPEKARA